MQRDDSQHATASGHAQAGSHVCSRLIEDLPAAVLTADAQARVTFANRAARMLLELLPGVQVPLLPLFGHAALLEHALRALPPGGETRMEFALPRAVGPARDLGLTVVRGRPDAASDAAYVLVFRDIDQRRQLELEQRRIERLNAIRIMVGGFAHELRNPLAGIQGLAEAYLAEASHDEQRREYVERMLPLLERIGRFVSASLRFGEPQRPERRSHAPAELIQAACDALAARWSALGARPQVEAAASLPPVQVDQAQIVEALLELIENALDAVGDPRRVRLVVVGQRVAGETRGHVRFEVRDDGPGVREGDLSHVFDPFFTTKPKATGLGLSVAQTLVRENGGRLLARSNPGLETVFSIVLPEAA